MWVVTKKHGLFSNVSYFSNQRWCVTRNKRKFRTIDGKYQKNRLKSLRNPYLTLLEHAHLDVTFSKNSQQATRICLPTRNDSQTAPPLFLKRLKADSFMHTLRNYADTFGFPALVIFDGEIALAGTLEQLRLPSVLLQHIHQLPYDRVTAVFWTPPQPSLIPKTSYL